jgi:hypothetical protein
MTWEETRARQAKIVNFLQTHSEYTLAEAALELGLKTSFVGYISRKAGIVRRPASIRTPLISQ